MQAHRWLNAANGGNDYYNNAVLQLLARDRARTALDMYFDAIERALKERA